MRADDEPSATMMAAPLSTRSDALIEAVFDPKRDHNYQPYRVFAEGGMGRILEARDHQLQRRVVLKVLQTDAPELRERFLREALITAKLQHPAIVPIYDFGQWSHQQPDTHLGLSGGEPYYVMKMVEGQSLGELMTAGGDLHKRLALLRHVITAAEAIAYAHERRVIHRDLKPDNILVGAFGETVVIDWGLAKELTLDGEEHEEQLPAARDHAATVDEALLALGETLFADQNQDIPSSGQRLTVVGTVMGTPDYMSPEQAAAGDVDFRADVWSLGAILYELLAGETPYGGNTVNEKMKLILSGPPLPLHLRVKGLPQDLAAIVAKAMAHLPDERYPSARELMDDLRRFETGQIVSAHRYTTRERVQRFITRHKVAFGVAALSLFAVMALSVFAVSRIIAARNTANDERDKADKERTIATQHADQLVLLQAQAATRKNPNAALSWLAELSPEASDWDQVRLLASDARSQGLSMLLRDHTDTVGGLQFSPDGRYLASMSDDHTARLYATDSWQSLLLKGASDEVWKGEFSGDGRRLLVRTRDHNVLVWDVDKRGSPAILRGPQTRLNNAVFSADGEQVASWSQSGLWLWDITQQRGELFQPTERNDLKLGASLDRRKIAWVSKDGMLTVWDWQGKPQTLLGHQDKQIAQIAFSADGQFIASGSDDGEIRLWSLGGGPARSLQLYEKLRFLRAIPKSGDFIATSFDGKVDRLNPRTGAIRHLAQDPSVAFGLAISNDGDKLAWCTSESVRFMELSTGRVKTLRGFEKRITSVALSPDGVWVAAASEDFSVRLWRIADLDGQRVAYWPKAQSWALSPDFYVGAALSRHGKLLAGKLDAPPQSYDPATYAAKVVALSADGSTVATGFKSGKIHVVERDGGTTRILIGHAGPVRQLSFAPDGRLISGGQDGRVLAWSKPFSKSKQLAQMSQPIAALVLTADGKHMAASSTGGELILWSGQEPIELAAAAGQPIHALAFTPDGATLLAGSEDYAIRAFDTATHKQRYQVSHQLQVGKIVVSPSGERFASLTLGVAGLQVWETQSGKRLLMEATSHRGAILDAAFSPDDTCLATAGADHDVRLWELSVGRSRVLSGHTAAVTHVRFADDGHSLFSAGRDGTIRRWYEDLPRGEEALRSWLSANASESIAGFRE